MTPLQRRLAALEQRQRRPSPPCYAVMPSPGETAQQAADRAGCSVMIAPAPLELSAWRAAANE